MTVFDDDGTICVLRRAPYACTWTPTGDDVGRATLLASAVDSAGLSTLGIVRVRVNRFATSLTQRQRHRKGVTRVTGRLVLPEGVTRAQGCNGNVKVRLRKARRTATVTRRCTYSAKLPFRPVARVCASAATRCSRRPEPGSGLGGPTGAVQPWMPGAARERSNSGAIASIAGAARRRGWPASGRADGFEPGS